MLRTTRTVFPFSYNCSRPLTRKLYSTTTTRPLKVSVLGAAGGIGQPLSLLLKLNPYISKLSLFDIHGAAGVAADLSHIDTSSDVQGYATENGGLERSVQDANVVIISAGVPRKPNMTRDDLFAINASIIHKLGRACAVVAPNAIYLVITNPVNSMVPVLKNALAAGGVRDSRKLIGVTTLDSVRASKFLSQVKGASPETIRVPIVGGHSGATIVPLLSQSGVQLSEKERDEIVHRIQFGGDEVVKAKAGAGSATLSMAYAGARMTNAVLRGLSGEVGVTECAYVESPLYTDQGVDFFSSRVTLGKEGAEDIHPVGLINDYETGLLETCLQNLKKSIKKGLSFVP
ncbi:malate dehydrogenase [Schizosaccharomyces japonicus yFS275]|uniref:Malate dehydrogenase n=1 Tax=Schizosaccharomyces japonicus (strain yFS275 / FY16936) TaxID=402676 RepID=B6JYT4_SCHJY|nr:malate dehydrogenase [Schizosaccharomyces japonicus yFS275]EEB06702.1 malate dehydrogenase [Schizosaccharomyces japonicus yFS275]